HDGEQRRPDGGDKSSRGSVTAARVNQAPKTPDAGDQGRRPNVPERDAQEPALEEEGNDRAYELRIVSWIRVARDGAFFAAARCFADATHDVGCGPPFDEGKIDDASAIGCDQRRLQHRLAARRSIVAALAIDIGFEPLQ